jgi:hypothetical protein
MRLSWITWIVPIWSHGSLKWDNLPLLWSGMCHWKEVRGKAAWEGLNSVASWDFRSSHKHPGVLQKVRAALADGSSDLQQHRIQFCQNLHKQSNRPFSRASRKACSFADALILAKVMTSVRLLVYRTVISLLFSKLLNLW